MEIRAEKGANTHGSAPVSSRMDQAREKGGTLVAFRGSGPFSGQHTPAGRSFQHLRKNDEDGGQYLSNGSPNRS